MLSLRNRTTFKKHTRNYIADMPPAARCSKNPFKFNNFKKLLNFYDAKVVFDLIKK